MQDSGDMKVNVTFRGRFSEIFGGSEAQVVMKAGGTVGELLEQLCDTDERRMQIFDKSERGIKPNVTVTRNGLFIIHLQWLNTKLSDGDRVNVFTIHAGG